MPVIYLPPDPRIAALGAGIGSALGGYSEGLVRSKVQQILAGPGSIQQKLPELYRVGGPQAIQFADEILRAQTEGMHQQVLGEQIKQFPLQEQKLKGDIASTAAGTDYTKAQTAQLPALLALRQRETAARELSARAETENAAANSARATAALTVSGAQRDALESEAKLHDLQAQLALFQAQSLKFGLTHLGELAGGPAGADSGATGGANSPAVAPASTSSSISNPSPPPPSSSPVPASPSPLGASPTNPSLLGKVLSGEPAPTGEDIPMIPTRDINQINLNQRERKIFMSNAKVGDARVLPGDLKVLPTQTIGMAASVGSEAEIAGSLTDLVLNGADTGGILNYLRERGQALGINMTPMMTAIEDQAKAVTMGRVGSTRGMISKTLIDFTHSAGPSVLKGPVNNLISIGVFMQQERAALLRQLSAYSGPNSLTHDTNPLIMSLNSVDQVLNKIKNINIDPKTKRLYDVSGLKDIPAKGMSIGNTEVTRDTILKVMKDPRFKGPYNVPSVLHFLQEASRSLNNPITPNVSPPTAPMNPLTFKPF